MSAGPIEPEIFRDLAEILAELRGDDSGPIGRETRFFADLGLASIDAVVLGESLQARYGQGLPFGDLMAELGRREDRDLVLGELVDFLRDHIHAARPGVTLDSGDLEAVPSPPSRGNALNITPDPKLPPRFRGG